jgi:hypothetical protein
MGNAIKNSKPKTEEKLLKFNKTRKFMKRKKYSNSEAVKDTKIEQKRDNHQSFQYSGLFLFTKI